MYLLNIRKNRDTGEFEVTHNVDGSINENLTYYTDDEMDAAQTLIRQALELDSRNVEYQIGSRGMRSMLKYGLNR